VGRAILKASAEMPSAECRMQNAEWRMEMEMENSECSCICSMPRVHWCPLPLWRIPPENVLFHPAHLHFLCCSAHLISLDCDQGEIKTDQRVGFKNLALRKVYQNLKYHCSIINCSISSVPLTFKPLLQNKNKLHKFLFLNFQISFSVLSPRKIVFHLRLK